MIILRTRLVTLILLGGILLGACAGDRPAASQVAASQLADITRTSLADAAQAASAYGQAHLGHYLDLRLRDLKREGFETASDVTLEIRSGHTGFCILATNEALPSIHPWSRGSASSRSEEPSSSDRCHR